MAKQYVDETFVAQHNQLVRWQRKFRVTGAAAFRNSPEGATLHVRGGKAKNASFSDPHFTARLGDATQDGTNKRWTYTFIEVKKTSAGYDGWEDNGTGRTGTAYNRIEEMNGASGLYGNGVDSANLTGTFDIQPAPDGLLVEMTTVRVAGETEPEYWFSHENGIDGECA